MSVEFYSPKGSIAFVICRFGHEGQPEKIISRIKESVHNFELKAENNGFHDLIADEGGLRGYYSKIEPFTVEHLDRNYETNKENFKRISSCEFFVDKDLTYIIGKGSILKDLILSFNCIGFGMEKTHFDTYQLLEVAKSYVKLTSVSVRNGKKEPIKTVKMTGSVEDFEHSDTVGQELDIESISGTLETSFGRSKLTVAKAGGIALKLDNFRGFIPMEAIKNAFETYIKPLL